MGWMGKFGNKGAVSISFDVLDKRVLVINNHLEAHMEYRQYRHDQWLQIYKEMVIP